MNRTVRIASVAAMVLLAEAPFSPGAQATFIVDVQEVGPNVVATGNGTINLTGLVFLTSSPDSPFVEPSIATLLLGPLSSTIDVYTGPAGPSSFGGGGVTNADTGTGSEVGIDGLGALAVPTGYKSGDPLSDTAVWDNATFGTLGLVPGTYTYTWGSPLAPPVDTFVVEIGVPEPSTLAVLDRKSVV